MCVRDKTVLHLKLKLPITGLLALRDSKTILHLLLHPLLTRTANCQFVCFVKLLSFAVPEIGDLKLKLWVIIDCR